MIFAALVLAVPLARTYFETGLTSGANGNARRWIGRHRCFKLPCRPDTRYRDHHAARDETACVFSNWTNFWLQQRTPAHAFPVEKKTSNAAGPRVEQSQFEMKYPENAQGSRP